MAHPTEDVLQRCAAQHPGAGSAMKRKGSRKEATRTEVVRVAAALRSAIRLSGVSHRRIERELGMSTGYLTRILAGQVELRLSHILDTCEIIDLPAGDFFASLFPRNTAAQPGARLARGLAQLHPRPGRTLDPEWLIQEVRGYLDQLEADVRAGAKAP